jgi:hypothetical protein
MREKVLLLLPAYEPNVIAPPTVRVFVPRARVVAVLFAEVAPNVMLAAVAAAVIFTVLPRVIVTGSRAVGTPLGVQLAAVFQLPPVAPVYVLAVCA